MACRPLGPIVGLGQGPFHVTKLAFRFLINARLTLGLPPVDVGQCAAIQLMMPTDTILGLRDFHLPLAIMTLILQIESGKL